MSRLEISFAMSDMWCLNVRRCFECSWTGRTGNLFYTYTSLIQRKFRIYVKSNRRQNSFVWRINTWISNKWRWIVSRNLEWSFESFWCLKEKLYHRRRKFNWLSKHFKIEVQDIFLILVITNGLQNIFFPLKNL